MAHEAKLEPTASGLAPHGDGWFVLNARDARRRHADGRTDVCSFDGDVAFPQLRINVSVLGPGELMAMYHWEADQKDFLVLAGGPLLVIEGEARRLRPWDLVHRPARTLHTIAGAGAGDGPSIVAAIGARDRSVGPDRGGHTVDSQAAAHGASVAADTTDPDEAYAHLPRRREVGCRSHWPPEDRCGSR
jgi:hypothetical protein